MISNKEPLPPPLPFPRPSAPLPSSFSSSPREGKGRQAKPQELGWKGASFDYRSFVFLLVKCISYLGPLCLTMSFRSQTLLAVCSRFSIRSLAFFIPQTVLFSPHYFGSDHLQLDGVLSSTFLQSPLPRSCSTSEMMPAFSSGLGPGLLN